MELPQTRQNSLSLRSSCHFDGCIGQTQFDEALFEHVRIGRIYRLDIDLDQGPYFQIRESQERHPIRAIANGCGLVLSVFQILYGTKMPRGDFVYQNKRRSHEQKKSNGTALYRVRVVKSVLGSHDMVGAARFQSTTQHACQSQNDGIVAVVRAVGISNVRLIRGHELAHVCNSGCLGGYVALPNTFFNFSECFPWVVVGPIALVVISTTIGILWCGQCQGSRSGKLGSFGGRRTYFVDRIQDDIAQWTKPPKQGPQYRFFGRRGPRSGHDLLKRFQCCCCRVGG
mmetsp:Transcript_3976/g.8051  ORF Transcript_3976/g.8051 Transcript_3976/m.8051 type:complete len:285 (-) Transcript_3976:255-1109(-)